ncbi:heme-degrading monooxygenase HmoA [Kineococcus radiotolerans]|uniref:Heme-degrading monooxygenase HmoA n=1 Tax=Kineococcus radiotolerans TaxID=131568 RepID=A0A7W4TSE4_KINRA|nr:heme-degrading monooxygenase HmoA [Kineococcus radiotolerans]
MILEQAVLEQAVLDVRPGRAAAFEGAFSRAKTIIAAVPGFRRLTLSCCLERPDTYLLLMQWDTFKDHTEGFTGSPRYQE